MALSRFGPLRRISLIAFASIALNSITPAWAETYRVHVDGLACPLCTFGIEKQLKKIKDVTSIETDLATSTVTIMSPHPIVRAHIEAAVKRAGFTLRGLDEVPQ